MQTLINVSVMSFIWAQVELAKALSFAAWHLLASYSPDDDSHGSDDDDDDYNNNDEDDTDDSEQIEIRCFLCKYMLQR